MLELYGASSASRDPPWFFVSPYEKNGDLVQFLKHVAEKKAASLMDVGGLTAAAASGASLTVPPTLLRGVGGGAMGICSYSCWKLQKGWSTSMRMVFFMEI